MQPFIIIFGHPFESYDVMLVMGFILASFYFFYEGARLKLDKLSLLLVILAGFAVQYFGGMILPLAYKILITHEPVQLEFWKQCPGRYFHSSLLSIFAYMAVVIKILKWPARKMFDILMISAMIMSAVGRIGCLLCGCCSGKPSDMPWAALFPYRAVAVHPTQLYMFFSELIIVIILMRLRRRQKYDGQTFWSGIFLYSFYRLIVEFYRTNPIFVCGLTHAQVFSVITLAVSGLYLYAKRCSRMA